MFKNNMKKLPKGRKKTNALNCLLNERNVAIQVTGFTFWADCPTLLHQQVERPQTLRLPEEHSHTAKNAEQDAGKD